MTRNESGSDQVTDEIFEVISSGASVESLTPGHGMAENGASVTSSQIANCSCGSCSSSNEVTGVPVSETL
ncbi:thiomuracin/GE37468 family thiazolyl RiPP peptide [uncultured Serinicoccus sp.]|uniref:thiomuracin/GE37468 family thiazolyl RiPP peptide n=1 Tax=uncultured Serinicoccus sp. TaxID=735514 RepID=UPI0026056BEB|nr:thiomuracin/GE37468 family thiazolyl RiPP peptide [uncultured Serinicoccus sp.]